MIKGGSEVYIYIYHFIIKCLAIWCDKYKQTNAMGLQIDGLVQDSNNSSCLTMELLQFCTEPSKCDFAAILRFRICHIFNHFVLLSKFEWFWQECMLEIIVRIMSVFVNLFCKMRWQVLIFCFYLLHCYDKTFINKSFELILFSIHRYVICQSMAH